MENKLMKELILEQAKRWERCRK